MRAAQTAVNLLPLRLPFHLIAQRFIEIAAVCNPNFPHIG
jgi:hypothetical protein